MFLDWNVSHWWVCEINIVGCDQLQNKRTELKMSECVVCYKYYLVEQLLVLCLYLCVLGCDVECVSCCGSWSEGLETVDKLKSYQAPDTVLKAPYMYQLI